MNAATSGIEPHQALGALGSLFWAALIVGALSGLLVLLIVRFFRTRGRVLRAQSLAKQLPVLAPGPALLVGKVETDDAGPAVRIEIDQVGTETKNKNSWSHQWNERHRAVQVRPFRLRAPNGDVVTVMPDERIQVVDNLVTARFEGTYRKRVAELSAGEQIWVSGVLALEGQQRGPSTAYRSGVAGWVLRGTSSEPLEVASGGLERQFAYWRVFYRWAAWLVGALWLVVHLFVVGPYLALLATGKVETLAITRTSTFITTSKNSRTTHYVIHAQLPAKAGGREVKDEVGYGPYKAALDGGLKQAPFIYCPLVPALHSIGDHASLGMIRALIGGVLAIVAMLLFEAARRNALPWYEQGKVVERGSGRLEESAWNIQVASEHGQFVNAPPKRPPPPAGQGYTKT